VKQKKINYCKISSLPFLAAALGANWGAKWGGKMNLLHGSSRLIGCMQGKVRRAPGARIGVDASLVPRIDRD
jgi:hypothetical protein